MKITGMFLFVMLLIGASLLAACGPAPASSANPGAPAVATLAPAVTSEAPPATLATAVPQSTNANSAPVSVNNCTLVTKDEVGTVLGEAVVDFRDPSKKGILCVYQTKNLILEMNTLHDFGGWVNSVKYMQETRVTNIGDSPLALDVPGLGDEAFYHGASAYRLLLVRKGDSVYSFGVRNVTADQSLSSPENAQAIEKAMAVLLLSRLS